MRKNFKTLLFTLFVLCIALGLSSCGGAKTGKNENEKTSEEKTSETNIKEDASKVLSNDANVGKYHLNINSFSITKRQTNPEDKTDFVWCEMTATGTAGGNYEPDVDGFSCSIEGKMTYVLYNDGWQLEEQQFNIDSIKPLSLPTHEWAESVANRNLSGIIPNQIEVGDMLQQSDYKIIYPCVFYYVNGARPAKYDLIIEFDLQYGWHFKEWYFQGRIG